MTLRLRRRPVPDSGSWPDSVHPVLRRVYAARGVLDAQSAELRLADLHPPAGMAGINAGVALLQQALSEHWRILIVGDFDCDGATASAVAVRGLRMLGAQQVDFRVPHRLRHGYGLSPALVADVVAESVGGVLPQLIITVDNGIASHAGVAAARAQGINVLVTDHHLPGATLPAANAIVDPHIEGDAFPSRHLAGVGVMFYLLLALRARLREQGDPEAGAQLITLLDLVALGTVADLVPLDRNNRILVEAGLRRLRSGVGNPGLLALAEVAGRRPEALYAADLGFALGPRINAAGRLEDMRIGIACLLSDDPDEARELAQQLDAINRQRRTRQAQMLDDAESLLELGGDDASASRSAVVVMDDSWHPGVVGLVASRLKDRLHRPAFAFAPAGEGEGGSDELRGSARSIAGYHIRDALAAVDAAHPGLITRFGGHAMAAGLSLPVSGFAEFSAAIEQHASDTIAADLLRRECWTDGDIEPEQCDRALAESLRAAGPWGQHFPEPLFDGLFEVREWRVVGERHLKLTLSASRGEGVINAIQFDGFTGSAPPNRVRAVYHLELDDFRDRRSVQLRIAHLLEDSVLPA